MSEITLHICTVCYMASRRHSERCDCGVNHWPPLCCPGCDCHSYENAHYKRVIRAALAEAKP